MNKSAKIYIAGHRGMVGSAILRRLHKEGYNNFVTRTSKELDLKISKRLLIFLLPKNLNMFF